MGTLRAGTTKNHLIGFENLAGFLFAKPHRIFVYKTSPDISLLLFYIPKFSGDVL